jgi:tRNA(fMet)-specific endonuclease VapC
MKYLLDTCVISDFVKSEPHTINKIKHISPSHIIVSTIAVMELRYGLYLNPERAKKVEHIINAFLATIAIIDFNKDDADAAAEINATLKQQGTPIGAYDVLLAGIARQRNLILVSSNMKEFQRVKNLHLENWRNT